MTLPRSLVLVAPILALALADAHDASACGGCFVPPEESTQVTGHRMMLSISKDETTLWDQIEYAGDPSSFAWVLPTKGQVEVGLSSDALFAFVEQATHVDVYAPPLNCPPPPSCWSYGGEDGGTGVSASAGAGGSFGGGGVDVIAQETVGPYETVQLSSQDPNALKQWLLDHGYNVPPDIAPIVDAYVSEGFNFLALKLVPGKGIDSMRPVRITSAGANPSLPLRMVAAGTGAQTKVTLFVVGEGRYEPSNFPSFVVDQDDLVWDWDSSSSNYATLKQKGFDATKGFGWLDEAGEPLDGYGLQQSIEQIIQFQPDLSGYGDAQGQGAQEEFDADIAKVFSTIPMQSMWISRLHAELPRAALGKDLGVGAASDQTKVVRQLQAKKWTGTVPACPTYPPCPDDTSSTTGGFGGLWGEDGASGNGDGSVSQLSTSCAMGQTGGGAALGGLGLALAMALARRRRR